MPRDRKTVVRRGIEIGSGRALACLPLVADSPTALLEQAGIFAALQPDLVEWRVDSLEHFEPQLVTGVLQDLRRIIGEIPLIFTCRHQAEGGFRDIPQPMRRQIILESLQTGCVDILDYEIANGQEQIREMREAAQKVGAALILSYHNFKETPEEGKILEKLLTAQQLGADVAKIAVMPRDNGDVLTLMGAALKSRERGLEIPFIAIAMGEKGVFSRVAGSQFGSCLTYAIGETSSAPGQIPLADLRKIWELLGIH